jgi:predicted transcriptional regulator
MKSHQSSIQEIMTKEVHTVDANDPLKQAREMFGKYKIRHLPVTSHGKLVGMISLTDILRMSFGNTFDEDADDNDETIFDMLSVNQVMKHSPVVVAVDSTVKEAGGLLADKEFHALPVLDDDKLVGIVTTTDIIRFFINQS